MDPLRVGIVGIGNISGIYLKNLSAFRSTEVVAVADIDRARAERAAAEYGVPNVLTPDELLNHPDVELVLNLTIPAFHADLARRAVRAGKHVYNEKPLATDLDAAREVIAEAKERNVLVGCAPDTFLGSGLQTARQALDAGAIGTPVGAQAFMLSNGPEGWHPNPEFFFKPGGGPMLDMGPYYSTALIHLLGGVRRTTGIAKASRTQRPIALSNGNYYGERTADTPDLIQVETSTHYVGVLEFEGGAVADLTTSFDVHHGGVEVPIKIFGTEGTMHVPDPNNFGGEVKVRRHDEDEWRTLPSEHGFAQNSRGIGVLDLAYAARTGTPQRASGALALHALDVMLSIQRASDEGRHQTLDTTVERPAPLRPDEYRDEAPTPATA